MAYTPSKVSLKQTSYNAAASIVSALVQAGAITPEEVDSRLMTLVDDIYDDLSAEFETEQATSPNVAASSHSTTGETGTFGIGKHKGKTFAQVAAEAPDYLKWVVEKSNMREKQAVINYLDSLRAGV